MSSGCISIRRSGPWWFLARIDEEVPAGLDVHLILDSYATHRRGAHLSVRALETDIRSWIATWNDDPRPYVWTKTADQILASLARYCERVSATAQAAARK